MEIDKDVFDMSDCRNLWDFIQKNFKCSDREAYILISKINFFKKVEDGADVLFSILEELRDEDLKWKNLDLDKIDLDFLAYIDDLKSESISDGYECNRERLYDLVIEALENATATELGLI